MHTCCGLYLIIHSLGRPLSIARQHPTEYGEPSAPECTRLLAADQKGQ